VSITVANPVFERLDRPSLHEFVERAVVAAVRRAGESTQFYRSFYRRHGVRLEKIATIGDVQRYVPLVSKQDLLSFQESLPGGGTSPTDQDTRQLHLTSGTTGAGREIYPRYASDLAGLGIGGGYEYTWAGLLPGDRLMLTMPYSQTMAGPYFQDTCAVAGLVPINGFAVDTSERLEQLSRFACSGISGTPSYIHRLTLEAERQGRAPKVELPSLKAIFLSGEPYGAEWAREIAEFWGARICEGWGATQTLGVAMCTCEAGAYRVDADGRARHAVMHGLDHRCWIDVIDPNGRTVAPGESGEIVVTTLRPGGQPAIRFRMADKVQTLPQGSCDCGRPFSCYRAGTVGRVDDMIKIRGMNVWPDAIDAIVLRAPVLDYRGRVYTDQVGRERVDISVAIADGTPGGVRRALPERFRQEIKSAVGITVDVRVVGNELPEEQFKSRRWLDQRALRLDKTVAADD
jgi:phenylacetate-CoA ligase